MLSQLGCIALPADTVEKLHHGTPLLEAGQKMVEQLPATANSASEGLRVLH